MVNPSAQNVEEVKPPPCGNELGSGLPCGRPKGHPGFCRETGHVYHCGNCDVQITSGCYCSEACANADQ
jgi:hypothetical protein